ncbi:hypothetical protein D9M68_503470 [compost metagenome]
MGMRRMRCSTPPRAFLSDAICASMVITLGSLDVKRSESSMRFCVASNSFVCSSRFCDSALRASSSRLMVPFWLRYWL